MRIVIDNLQYIDLLGGHGKPSVVSSNLKNEDPNCEEDLQWNMTIDVLESLVLAHFMAGVNVAAEAYRKGIQTTLEALENHIA